MNRKQGILIIADGLGDRPNLALKGLTPLEAAKTPNLEGLLSSAICGNVHPVKAGIPVGTDVGHIQIFGYDYRKVYTGRGAIEAFSGGIKLKTGDVAFRGNFGTIDENCIVTDRRAGRINEDTNKLAKALNGMILEDGTEVLVNELTEHRVAIVFRGRGLSDKVEGTDPGTAMEGSRLKVSVAKDNREESKKTAKNVNEFMSKANKILGAHEVNKKRKEAGKIEANTVLLRGAGIKTEMKSIFDRYSIKAAVIAGDLTINGIGKMCGMDTFSKEIFTGSYDSDILGKGALAAECIDKGYDWVVVHVKATDLAGHDNLPFKKVEIIEKIDKMIGYISTKVDMSKTYISITGDHSTPCEVRDHSGDPVPTLISGPDLRKDGIEKIGESYFAKGALQNLNANDIFRIQMDLLGFVKKVGA